MAFGKPSNSLICLTFPAETSREGVKLVLECYSTEAKLSFMCSLLSVE